MFTHTLPSTPEHPLSQTYSQQAKHCVALLESVASANFAAGMSSSQAPGYVPGHVRDPAPFSQANKHAAGHISGHATQRAARYDVLLALPDERLIYQNCNGQPLLSGAHAEQGDFFSALAAWQRAVEVPCYHDSQLPFHSGWFIYASYELAASIENKLQLPMHEQQLLAAAIRCHGSIVVDHLEQTTTIQAETEVGLEQLLLMLNDTLPLSPATLPEVTVTADDGKRFLQSVQDIQRYILDGDVFQVNLSRGWSACAVDGQPLDPLALYTALSATNPAPYAAICRLPMRARGEPDAPEMELTIISSSPERLLRGNEQWLETRPIAGTRPRVQQGGAEQDAAMRQELLQHPKERAEHIMLIDLERNDLGRVCVPGTVEVDELMSIESYAHVHHIVSNVRGRPRPNVSFAEALAAVFPGGTITGCPKVRCMEIIAEQEAVPRQAYTGSLGYLDLDGRFDSNILIRSFSLFNNQIQFRAGAGIVADSDAHKELTETAAKAKGMLLALGVELNSSHNQNNA